jgi:hypothetical protein
MTIIYYIDGEKFIVDDWFKIENMLFDFSSPNEETPAWENLETGKKVWCLKGYRYHRLTGPAIYWASGDYSFGLYGIFYDDIYDWLKIHPNQDNSFQIEMLLKYT